MACFFYFLFFWQQISPEIAALLDLKQKGKERSSSPPQRLKQELGGRVTSYNHWTHGCFGP